MRYQKLKATARLILRKNRLLRRRILCIRRSRLKMHFGFFLPPFDSVLLRWLKELAHAVCFRSRINNQKQCFFRSISVGFHRLLGSTMDPRYILHCAMLFPESPCLHIPHRPTLTSTPTKLYEFYPRSFLAKPYRAPLFTFPSGQIH